MPLVQTPVTIGAYPSTTVDGIWIFPWALTFDKAIWDPQTLRYELQVDTFPTFSSPNLIDVFSNSATITNYQNGPLGKAVELLLPRRQTGINSTWYWRMRINGLGYAGQYVSNWSQTNQLIVPQNQSLSQAQLLFNDIADQFAYSKGTNSSNLYKILAMIGREFDSALLENAYSQRDLLLDQARDTGIANNFGTLTQLAQVATEPAVSFRWKVRQLFKSFLDVPGVLQGILQVVEAFVGEPPTILDDTNTVGWILPINFIKAPGFPKLQPTIKLFSSANKGFDWTLIVFNSWNLSYDPNVLENYVNLIKPAHTKTTFLFPANKHAQIRYNTTADWASTALSNLTTNQSQGLTLSPAQTSGTSTTPVLALPWTLSGWSTLELDQTLSGGTTTVQIQSAPAAAGPFSGYETVPLGSSPSSTPLNSFVQLKVTITTSNASNQPIINSLQLNLIHT